MLNVLDEPSPTLLGEILALSTGIDAQAVAPVSKEDFVRARTMSDDVFSQGNLYAQVFFSEFQAIYLPAFIRTFYSNTVGDFNAIDSGLFAYYTQILYQTAASPYSDRFLRVDQRETTKFHMAGADTLLELISYREEIRRPLIASFESILDSGWSITLHQSAQVLEAAFHKPRAGPEDMSDEEFAPHLQRLQDGNRAQFEKELERDEKRLETGKDERLEMGGRGVEFDECATREGGFGVRKGL